MVSVTDTSSNGTFVNGKLIGRGNSVTLKHEDIISLLIPNAEADEFDPEESVMYRFHNLIAPAAMNKMATPFLAAQKNSPMRRMFASSDQLKTMVAKGTAETQGLTAEVR